MDKWLYTKRTEKWKSPILENPQPLGIHKKYSNFASRYELGRIPILSFITSLTYKYYSRLEKFPSTRLVKEAFDVDRGL